jgi:glycerate-2-kinase
MRIKNKKALLTNAESLLDRKARSLALNALETALDAVDARDIIQSKVVLKGNTLQVDGHSFDLKKFRNIYVIGGGKASGSMAESLEEILGDHITTGMVNVPRNKNYNTKRIKLQPASHPVPDKTGVKGAKRMLSLASEAGKSDLIICLISGGGSSLMPLPHERISLKDKAVVTKCLLKSGATINEINTVRKHISCFKGGWLAKKAYPATVINLVLSDVVGDALDAVASGPTVPDHTTFEDSIEVLKRYGLWNEIPESVKEDLLLGKRGMIPETPKIGDEAFTSVHNVIVGNNRSASLAAYHSFHNARINPLLLTSILEGEARHVGTVFAAIAREISISGRPIAKPAGFVAGGETTVTVTGNGMGGRNQEIVLSAALKISQMDGVAVCSISTDGVDGPTNAAGALSDGNTIGRSRELGLHAKKHLSNNDSYTFFSKLDDLVFTGSTGTNVNDVSVIVVL